MVLIVFRKATEELKRIKVEAIFKNISYVLQNCAVPQRHSSSMHPTDRHQINLQDTRLGAGTAKTSGTHILPSKGLQSRKRFELQTSESSIPA